MPVDNSKLVLLTGATGFLGQYILAYLLSDTSARVRVLVRTVRHDVPRLQSLLADLSVDMNGLHAAGRLDWVEGALPDRLSRSAVMDIHTIIHAAARTRLSADKTGELVGTNIEGTRALLKHATACNVRHFVYISTAYVCGTRCGPIDEVVATTPPRFCNEYEKSKWAAEQLACQWQTHRRVTTICRPSILFGDSTTGRTTSSMGVYMIARATGLLARAAIEDPYTDRHAIPLRILGRPEATCNLIPVDAAARRIVEVATDADCHGQVHHLTNPSPPTHAEIKAWLEEYFDIGGGRFSDEPWPLRDANRYESAFYTVSNLIRDYFRDGLVFKSCKFDAMPGRMIDRDSFIRSLSFAHARNWGRNPSKSVSAGHGRQVDPAWYCETYLPAMVPRSSVARVHSLSIVVAIVIGDASKRWVCRFESGKLCGVHPDNGSDSPDCCYRVSQNAFSHIATGQQTLQQAFFDGEADFSGDIEQALRLVPIMAAFIREYPVRDD